METETAEPQAAPSDLEKYNAFFDDACTKLDSRAKTYAAREGVTLKAINWGDLFAKLIEALMGCFGGALSPSKLKNAANRPGIFGRMSMRRVMNESGLSRQEGSVVMDAMLDECKQASNETLATFCAAYGS